MDIGDNTYKALPGVLVGHYTDPRRPTGVTVVLTPAGAVGGVDVRGAAPGTRETDLLDPVNTVAEVHGVVLAGGSAFGLAAATGVMDWLEENGHGLAVGPVRVPIVPAAVLFDLFVGDPRIRPDAAAGWAACQAALRTEGQPLAMGAVGAGAGCTVGKVLGIDRAMPSGIGAASVTADGVTVSAIVACNAVGDVLDPRTGQIVAGARVGPGSPEIADTRAALRAGRAAPADPGTNTTIGVIVTDARLDKAGAKRLAISAHDGIARVVRPAHTPMDGDTLFALATGTAPRTPDLLILGSLAEEATEAAILAGVRAALVNRE
ncbi:MAG: P1 family peptidase [Candidatus Nanopelagicales bacterium]